ncbi:hypothetical protein NON20_19745 [Synechocystis sp. B12]|nr:hypothetical protein NON20_19745 [Synechocystis sp. B12]
MRAQLNVRLWTAGAGLVAGGRSVLEALAAVQMEESNQHELPRRIPLLWITGRADSVQDLASYSRWLYFAPPGASASPHSALCAGLTVEVGKDLSQQLQRPPNFSPRMVS